jgi:hypothetical protein
VLSRRPDSPLSSVTVSSVVLIASPQFSILVLTCSLSLSLSLMSAAAVSPATAQTPTRASAAPSASSRGPFLITDVMERGCGGAEIFNTEVEFREHIAGVMQEFLREGQEEAENGEEGEEGEEEEPEEAGEMSSFTNAQVAGVRSGAVSLEASVQLILDFQGNTADHSRSGSCWLTVVEIVQPSHPGERATFRSIGQQAG